MAASVRMVSFSRTSMAQVLPGGGPAVGPAGGPLDGVDGAEELRGQERGAYKNEKESPASHE